MNKKIKEKSISFNYMQTLFKNLHNLQQVGSVDEYTKAFYQLIARVYLNESEERMMEGILVAWSHPFKISSSCICFRQFPKLITEPCW